MSKLLLTLLTGAVLFSAACSRPPDNSPSKFRRDENLKKYVQQARDAAQRAEQRKQPLPVPALPDTAGLTNITPPPDGNFLPAMFARNRRIMEKRLRETYGEMSAVALAELAEMYRSRAMTAARGAASPQELAQNLRQLQQWQNEQINAFIAARTTNTRLKPDETLLSQARTHLQRRSGDFLSRLAFDYGEETAARCRPVLDGAVEQYLQALASAPDEETLNADLARAEQQAAEQISLIVRQTGDPLGVTPETDISAWRAELIAAHQDLEKQVEKLYGKEAVLQTREVFNRYLDESAAALEENTRLSRKKRELEHLREHYADRLLELQARWNAARAERAPVSSSR